MNVLDNNFVSISLISSIKIDLVLSNLCLCASLYSHSFKINTFSIFRLRKYVYVLHYNICMHEYSQDHIIDVRAGAGAERIAKRGITNIRYPPYRTRNEKPAVSDSTNTYP